MSTNASKYVVSVLLDDRAYLPIAALALAAITLAMIPNLSFWPLIEHDEIQIIDFGRTMIDPDTGWSAGWMVNFSEPYLIPNYLGVLAQELFYQLFKPGNFGPRLSTLLGATVASGLLLVYLLKRETPKWIALLLAVVFFADPIFNLSYRQGRVDSWAMALIFLACVMLRHAGNQESKHHGSPKFLAGVGSASAASFFVWPSALALFPLLALEFIYLVAPGIQVQQPRASFVRLFQPMIWVLTGAVITTIVLLVPIALQWESYALSWAEGGKVQSTATALSQPFFGMYTLYDPLILPTVFIALLVKREYGLILAAALCLWMMYQTMMYPMRIIYLLPYYLVVIAGAYSHIRNNPDIRWRHALLVVSTTALLGWNTWESVVERPLMARQASFYNPVSEISDKLQASIGEGDHRVFLQEWDMYFAARNLGWQYYRLYGSFNPKSEEFAEFLSSMDYVIVRDKLPFLRAITVDQIESLGFRLKEKIEFAQPVYEGISFGPISIFPTDMKYDNVLVYENREDADDR